MIIRELRPGDIDALAALAADTYAETFGHRLTPAQLGAAFAERRSTDYFSARIERDVILVASIGERIVGYVQLGDVGFAMVERPLMDAAFAHPRLERVDQVFIDVWEENERAVCFYRSYGFETVGHCRVEIDGEVVGRDLVLARPTPKP